MQLLPVLTIFFPTLLITFHLTDGSSQLCPRIPLTHRLLATVGPRDENDDSDDPRLLSRRGRKPGRRQITLEEQRAISREGSRKHRTRKKTENPELLAKKQRESTRKSREKKLREDPVGTRARDKARYYVRLQRHMEARPQDFGKFRTSIKLREKRKARYREEMKDPAYRLREARRQQDRRREQYYGQFCSKRQAMRTFPKQVTERQEQQEQRQTTPPRRQRIKYRKEQKAPPRRQRAKYKEEQT